MANNWIVPVLAIGGLVVGGFVLLKMGVFDKFLAQDLFDTYGPEKIANWRDNPRIREGIRQYF